MRAFPILLSILVVMTNARAETLTPERLWDLARIGDAAVSPDGKSIAYLVTRYDLAENEGTVSLLLQPLPQTPPKPDGKVATAFDTPLQTAKAKTLLKDIKGLGSLAWLDHTTGAKLVYIAPGKEAEKAEGSESKAGESEEGKDEKPKPQVWMLDPSGGEPKQLTSVENGVANLKSSPSGDAIAFTVDVKMDKKVTEIFEDLPKADARIIDSLMFRHWNAWHDYAYSHLHTVMIDDSGNASEPIDLMPSLKADCPLPPFGGREQFTFSPDGKQVALTIKLVNNPAESTDSSIFLVDTNGGTLRNITPGMAGYDMDPAYSPDGRFIAFHSMERAGFEADRNRIMLYDRNSGEMEELTKGIDQTTHRATWSADSKRVYFDSETHGTHQVFSIDLTNRQLTPVSSGRFNFKVIGTTGGSEQDAASERVIVAQENMLRPTELGIIEPTSKQVTTITDVNGTIFAKLELPTIEERFFTATDGKQIHNWVILPPGYRGESDSKSEPAKQWPMLTYCQGGPQGQIGQWFSYRWNFHMMAAKGYVVLAVNRRGMPGFGQEWNDQISGDWGGQAMQDILASTDAMIADPKIDPSRVAAIGASFGGYTVYWLMGNSANRFCSMIAHCGVFNLESMYGSTEELFFVNHDLGGPYWKSEQVAADYERFSPHKFAGNWKTPLLVIHGEKDFRVPVTQGMEAFTAAQVQGVESRFLYFPDEGHWVLSPQNGVVWGRVFFDWLDQHCQKP
ncbi:Prolyl tripeptidyl peptidase precursor [Novipirellula aureliae]|uniref:Prolyl tripeptidyl peptidase n=1 Tax=Novipirellula aureliae TaxID=2527966 RepID=A0A5C6EA55_9BACT|nr:S9 family peptidase [Novipirellula aureliae]TWU45600.1 Prolyl tripeptidyl peptidase precursor [Novipirellula aureliae]